jgi:hypothetical protein
MKFGILLFIIVVFYWSCSKDTEPEPCSVSSFLGTWKVKEDEFSTNCALDSSNVFTIVKGNLPNEIKMKFDRKDSLIFQVWDCTANTGDSSVGAISSIKLTFENGKIKFSKLDLVFLIPFYCNMTLIKE